jgi:hypothetical protein
VYKKSTRTRTLLPVCGHPDAHRWACRCPLVGMRRAQHAHGRACPRHGSERRAWLAYPPLQARSAPDAPAPLPPGSGSCGSSRSWPPTVRSPRRYALPPELLRENHQGQPDSAAAIGLPQRRDPGHRNLHPLRLEPRFARTIRRRVGWRLNLNKSLSRWAPYLHGSSPAGIAPTACSASIMVFHIACAIGRLSRNLAPRSSR